MAHCRRICLAGLVLLVLTASTQASIGKIPKTSSALKASFTSVAFTAPRARQIHLNYRFVSPSKTFTYRLSRRVGSKWKLVRQVRMRRARGHFHGRHFLSVKHIFWHEGPTWLPTIVCASK